MKKVIKNMIGFVLMNACFQLSIYLINPNCKNIFWAALVLGFAFCFYDVFVMGEK